MRSRITIAVYRLRVGHFGFKSLDQFQFKRVGQFEFKRLGQVAFKRADCAPLDDLRWQKKQPSA